MLRAFDAALFVALAAPSAASAQGDTTRKSPSDSSQAGAVRAFLDCQSSRCDYDFMRDQLRWVNWVRDRLFADVQILVTSLATGSGGTEMTVNVFGLNRFRGKADTVRVVIGPTEADDSARRKLARTFALLLAPYAAQTNAASLLTLSYAAPVDAPTTATPARDRWNYWVYRVGANGYTSGEQQSRFRYFNLNTSASRTTEAIRASLGANIGYNESRYELGGGESFLNLQRNYGGSALVVKSLGARLSMGATASINHSDYLNQDVAIRIAPAIEYDFFPYRDFTRRKLTLYYALGVASFRYGERTIFDRDTEVRPVHNGDLSWSARQPWGNVNVSVFGSQYLHDLKRYNYGAGGNISLRIAKGLSMNFGGNYSRVADQLYLRKGQLDDTQIIARQRALATGYRYYSNFGISYTFGSIFNSIVNPRFGGGSGDDYDN